VQKILMLLHGILKRAKRRGWVATNAAEDAERVTVKRSGDFTVLTPVEVEAVARAAESARDAAIFVTAAFTGLRMGELRALRWRCRRTVAAASWVASAGPSCWAD
jgi:integrase